MYHYEGLCLGVEFALVDGLQPTCHDVAHVIIWGFCGAQGELGHNVGEVCDPFSGGGQGSGSDSGAVICNNTHTHTQVIMRLLW